MKKIWLFISFVLAISGCATYTQQDLQQGLQISPGMSKDQVLQIMGNPVSNTFEKGVEEWHYCDTNSVQEGDDYLALFFTDGEVVALKRYLVTMADVNAVGDCTKFVRMGNFSEPDSIREIRLNIR